MKALMMRAEWDPRPGYVPDAGELASGKARMASQVWRHPTFHWETLPDPVPGRDEVLLRIRRCGVCGSDTHCYETDADGYILFSGPTRLPCVVGHEYTAEVVEVGPDVKHLRVGDLVCAEGMLSCGACETCRVGRPNQCPALEMVGFSSPGAYAELIVAKERFLWRLDGLADRLGSADSALELAALVEPIGCAYNGMFVSAGGLVPGSWVAVFGCGPIGLGAIALARAAGAAGIVGFDVVPERVELARTLGADEAYDPRNVDVVDVIRTLTRGQGADMMVEAAGAAHLTMPAIERSFAAGGRMVYLGRTGLRAPVMLDVLVTQAAGIVGARGHSGQGCFPRILRLMERGRLDVAAMVTSRYAFDRALDALQKSTDRRDGKVMIAVDGSLTGST
ncbi:MAG: alcohol dehydrogenase catalytic domain-containing protein [Deltaproteobacteria bacterium]|nr:alcohol dehydrogenase catalytic domain-containing protein [Deltaproteobacteria bacterium]